MDVRVLRWVEQVSECLPDGGGTQTFAAWPELAFIVHTIDGLTPSRSGGTSVQNGGPGRPLGGSPASQGFLGQLARIRWRWLEIIGVPIAIVAAIGAYWQANATEDSLQDDRRAERFATAHQVLILGPTAPKDIQETPGSGKTDGIIGTVNPQVR